MGGGGNVFKNIVSNPIATALNPVDSLFGSPLEKKPAQVLKNVATGQPFLGGAPGGTNSNIPDPTAPNYSGDANQISGLTDQINKLYGNQMSGVKDTYGQQQAAEKSQIDQSTKDMITNLTTGQQGEGMREQFNNMGILNSGAFNQGLANAFAPIQQQANQDILSQNQQQFGDARNILGQQTQADQGLASGGTQRQFSLEDWYNNAMQNKNLAQSGANVQLQTGNQNANSNLLGSLIGGGATIAAK